MKKNIVFITIFLMGFLLCSSLWAFNNPVSSVLSWVKDRWSSEPAPSVPLRTVQPLVELKESQVPLVCHNKRELVFENDIPEFFDMLKDDPQYKDVPSLIDQTIIVNGMPITPGTQAKVMVFDNQFYIGIKLHKGVAKLIYAMKQGTLKGLLMRLLKNIEPWILWQCSSIVVTVPETMDHVMLSDVILSVYDHVQDLNAVNQRFKWLLIVDISLNEKINL